MAHDHDHHAHAHHGSVRRIGTAFFLNAVFTLVEFIGGYAAQSYAVISGALHDTGDLLVLGSAWYLQRASVRKRDARNTYGYARYRSMGGALTALVLIAGSLVTLAMAVRGLTSPSEPRPSYMIVLALVGVLMNGLAFLRLRNAPSPNEQGVGMHFPEDVLGWVAVLVGGLLIYFTQWRWVDPVLSMAIAIFILVRAIALLRSVLRVLMQGLPEDFDAPATRSALLAIEHVLDVHDMHAWSLDGNYTVLTVHLVVDTMANAGSVKQSARGSLSVLGIDHATIEVENAGEECKLQDH